VWIAVVGSSVVVTRLKRGKKRARSRRGWANLRTHDGLSHAGEVLPVGHGVTFRGVGDGRDAELVLRKDDGGGSVSLKVVREKIPRRAEEVRRRRRASWMIPLQVPLHLHSRLELLSSIL
jgi:hypothetical protein